MKCVVCKKGETKAGKAVVTLIRGRTTFVVKNVPDRVCSNCGEEYVDEATTGRLLREADEVAKLGTLVDVRDYVAA